MCQVQDLRFVACSMSFIISVLAAASSLVLTVLMLTSTSQARCRSACVACRFRTYREFVGH